MFIFRIVKKKFLVISILDVEADRELSDEQLLQIADSVESGDGGSPSVAIAGDANGAVSNGSNSDTTGATATFVGSVPSAAGADVVSGSGTGTGTSNPTESGPATTTVDGSGPGNGSGNGTSVSDESKPLSQGYQFQVLQRQNGIEETATQKSNEVAVKCPKRKADTGAESKQTVKRMRFKFIQPKNANQTVTVEYAKPSGSSIGSRTSTASIECDCGCPLNRIPSQRNPFVFPNTQPIDCDDGDVSSMSDGDD